MSKATLDSNAGELDRHLVGTKIGPRGEDKSVLLEDYPLLPVRRRFWEHALRAVDRAGTAGQLRTQLRIVYDAIRRTADEPLGTVVPADFLFEEISANLPTVRRSAARGQRDYRQAGQWFAGWSSEVALVLHWYS